MKLPFSRTTLWVIIPVAAVSLIVAIALTVFGDDLASHPSSGADGYSRSAIGHRGMVAILERLDVPVIQSRSDSGQKAAHGLLVLAEPALLATDSAAIARLHADIRAARTTLIVLPKWYGMSDRGEAWVKDSALVPADEVLPVLSELGVHGRLARGAAPVAWQGGAGPGPVIREPQTLAGVELEAAITGPDGALFGSFQLDGDDAPAIWILTDPDVLNNFGLREPANARFTIALVDQLRAGGPVVLDETTHGYAKATSLWRALFEFPLVLATLQALICTLLIVWAAMVRFGPRRAAPPPIAPGKDFLVRNTAALLSYGGHHGHALRRYLATTIQAVRHALHAPSELPAAALTAWLERVRQTRGGQISLPDLTAAVEAAPAAPSPTRVVELADQIYRWREEMIHGPHNRS
ncbi:MAG: hypothetical protein K8W52_00185 [Deltaproteobacteria bacterium]|nr:hypothetical protein [Deltaproteobacteria bacterium]